MEITGKTALVTGANRGLGRHLARELRDRGATVYAAARNPASVDLPGVTPIALDVTDPGSVAAAAALAENVAILINNAGSSTGSSLLTGDLANVRLELDTHFFGTLDVIRAFAPQLAAQGDSAVLNVLSALSWISFPGSGAYCAAKSAEWSLTNDLGRRRPQVQPGRHRQDRDRRHHGRRRRDHRRRGQQAGTGRALIRCRRPLPPARLTGRPRVLAPTRPRAESHGSR